MTPQQIVGLGVRLFAVWLALSALENFVHDIPALLTPVPGMDRSTAVNLSVVAVLALLFVATAVLLWMFPMAVAHTLIPKTAFANVLRVSPLETARVGCCLLGLWLLTESAPSLVWFLF